MPSEIVAKRDRLVFAVEAQTNMLARLVALYESHGARGPSASSKRSRRVADSKPITMTPLVEAAVRRALQRVRSSK
jgi:hypothetical protein